MEILRVSDLTLSFHNGKNAHNGKVDHTVVDHVNLTLNKGEILGIVGESGSGKSMLVHRIMGLEKKNQTVDSGEIFFEGEDLLKVTRERMRSLMGDELSIVFQEPMTSLNPVHKIGPQVEEGLLIHKKELSDAQRRELALQAMRDVELPDVEDLYKRYPHELSGGQRQRAMIASAIVTKPQILICDEPTTALDVTIQAQIIRMLKKLNEQTGMSIIFISHNLRVIKEICSRVMVMQNGKVVEEGEINELFRNPKEEYTKKLIAAIPTRSKRRVH